MGILKLFFLLLLILNSTLTYSIDLSKYNVIWNSPSKDASGVMPIGNGDMAAGVYAIENGSLYLLLSKNDAYNYCGDLFKTGRVKITFMPNPFIDNDSYIQELDIETGSVNIKSDKVDIMIWVDANNPVCHISAKSDKELDIIVEHDLWERFDHCVYNVFRNKGEVCQEVDYGISTQDSIVNIEDGIMWFYNVGDRSVYQNDLKYYNVEYLYDKYEDPYKYNIFGNYVRSDKLSLKEGRLVGKSRHHEIQIYSLTMKTRNSSQWINKIKELAESKMNIESWKSHCKWWSDFWKRGWIISSDTKLSIYDREVFYGEHDNGMRKEKDIAALVSQNYQMFRYFMATQGRGPVPVKFNGGLFTQQLLLPFNDKMKRSGCKDTLSYGLLTHPDDRLWGRRFTFQNQRHLYWPLLGSGDYDLIQPFFDYYLNLLPHRKAVTKEWFGHDGAYLRENIEPTGMERDCGNTGKPLKAESGTMAGHYHDFYFTSTLELLAMMINYAEYTNDGNFIKNKLLPYAREVLKFYYHHYKKNENGKMVLEPAMVLETYWKAKNPAPDIAGLKYCIHNLIRLDYGNDDDIRFWNYMKVLIPEIPLGITDKGEKYILPAEVYENKKNYENGELYPVFPFNMYGKAYGNEDIVINTMYRRTVKDAFNSACWTQDQIDWAYCGDTINVVEGLEKRFTLASKQCRFPLFGRENPDSCPDFDHLGAGAFAYQRMLVQECPERIYLFPSWPLSWDVNFKIFTSRGFIECVLKGGKIIKLITSSELDKSLLFFPKAIKNVDY